MGQTFAPVTEVFHDGWVGALDKVPTQWHDVWVDLRDDARRHVEELADLLDRYVAAKGAVGELE